MAKITVYFGSEVQGEFNLDRDEMRVGRAADCDIVVDNMGVSRHHGSMVKEGESWAYVDKGSNNGSFLDGKRIDGSQVLKDADRVILGKHSLVFDAFGYATEDAAKKSPAAMGSEMTMFVDPEQMKKMQEDFSSGPRMALGIMQGSHESKVQLSKPETFLGKGAQADVPVKGFLVKAQQAKVVKTELGHRIIALGGWRAVKVNGSTIRDASLKAGDVIVIAGTTMTYKQV